MSESGPRQRGFFRRALRWVGLAVLAVIALGLLVAVVALVIEAVQSARDERRFPPRGELVDVGGRVLHLECRGEGEPTIVIDAGAQDWSTGWQRPQAALSEHTKTCTYDRAGLGWSERSPEPTDGVHMADDLHRLLEAADVSRPVVLVGHSLGGMVNRIYYDKYPHEVAGMVLIEPGDPDQLDAMFEDLLDEAPDGPALGPWVETMAAAVARLGLVRWMYRDLMEDKGYPEQEVAETRAMIARPRAVRALAATMRHLPVTSDQARANRSLGSIPLAVVYSSKFDEYGVHFENDAEREEFRADSFAHWNHLVGLSSRGRGPIVIEGGNHLTMVRDDKYWPGIVDVILEIVDEARMPSAGELAESPENASASS